MERQQSKDKEFDIDIYGLMAAGLKIGLRYEDYGKMDYVTLINLLDASLPPKKEPYKKATQKDIDMIT